MKKSLCILMSALILALAACSAGPSESSPSVSGQSKPESSEGIEKRQVVDAILATHSSKTFKSKEVSDEDIKLILETGIKAPSARNSQPWHLSVVRDVQTIRKYIDTAHDGMALIIVSGTTEPMEGVNVALDCGLATENMYIAAQSLDLGAHLYAAPISKMNEDKDTLGIPDGYDAIVAILIGYEENPSDASSSATTRNSFEDMVTYAK